MKHFAFMLLISSDYLSLFALVKNCYLPARPFVLKLGPHCSNMERVGTKRGRTLCKLVLTLRALPDKGSKVALSGCGLHPLPMIHGYNKEELDSEISLAFGFTM